MDTIVTPVTVITLDSTRIVHNIKADLVGRYFPPVVRLVQYDQSLPVIAVSLMQNGQTYTLPSGAAANIRVHKPDATYVYNPALGCDSTRNIVYFEVTQAMAAANGDGLAIVEIVVDGDIAGTSLITLHFEENPVPEDAIESSDEWETIYELGERIIASTVTPVSTAAGMTDQDVVYLYTGTESGWNQGHMYYYNGTTWVDAGIAVTDTTLSVAGLAADAKKTGDEIADLKDGLNKIQHRKYVFIGDSYLEGYNPEGNNSGWGTYLVNQLGLSAADYTISYSGGAGFSSANGSKTNTFLNLITQLNSSEDVTDVVCCGGYNDQALAHTTYEIWVGIREFCKEAKIKFPNAVVSIGFIGWNKQGNGSSAPQDWEAIHSRLLNKVIPAYQTCIQYSHYAGKGCRYLTNVEYWINDSGINNTDGFHPTEMGNQRIAMGIGNALNGSAPNATWIRPDYLELQNDLQQTTEDALNAYATDTVSGAMANFPDGAKNVPVKSLTVAIKPSQKLNGYAEAWFGGGGKNIVPLWGSNKTYNGVTVSPQSDGSVKLSGTASATGNCDLTSVVTLKANETYSVSIGATGIEYGIAGYGFVNHTVTPTSDYAYAQVRIRVVSGTAYNQTLYPQIEKGSSATSFAPYSNICPISGYTSAVVTRAGKNLIPFPYSQGTFSTSGITFTVNDDGSVTVNGTATATAWFRVYGNFTSATSGKLPVPSWIKAGVPYVLSGSVNDYARIQITLYDAANGTVKEVKDTGSGASFTVTEKQLSDSETCAIFIRINSGQTLNNAVIRPQIEVGTAFTEFEPYTVQTATIDLGGTRYGGSLDVGTGVLTVTHSILDENNFGAPLSDTSGGGLHWVETSATSFDAAKTSACSMLVRKDGNSGWESSTPCYTVRATGTVRIYCNESTESDFKSVYADLQMVCGIASPSNVQLSANEMQTVLGQNNVWADCGDTEVEYRADTKLYIEKLTAPTEDDMIADHAISANTFFMVGNTLYRATTAIASGATITVGTNATRMSLADALNTLS